jgi:MFS family permease
MAIQVTAEEYASRHSVAAQQPPAALQRLLGPYAVLQGNRPLALLFVSGSLSALVDWLAVVAICALAYRLTQSAALVALFTFTRLLPYALLVPATGVLTDHADRRVLMVAATAGRALCLIGLCAVQSRTLLPLAFVCVGAATLLSSLFRPALLSTLPQVVRERNLVQANALFSQVDMLAIGAGPVVASVILAVGNERLAFLLGAIGLVGAATVLIRLRIPAQTEPASPERAAWPAEMLAGFRFLIHAQEGTLLGVGLTLAGLSLANGAWWTIATVLAAHDFHLGGQGLGFLMAAYSMGGFTSGLAVGDVLRGRRITTLFIVGAGASSLALAGVGLSPAGAFPFVCMFALGLADVVTKVISTTLIQAATPVASLGRVVGALESGLMAATVIGSLAVSPLIAAVGVRAADVLVGAAGLLLLVVSLPLLLPLVRGRVPGLRTFLHQVPVLSVVPVIRHAGLAACSQLERFPCRPPILRRSEPGDRPYLIKRGKVEVVACGS